MPSKTAKKPDLKKNALAFLKLIIAGKIRQAYDRYAAPKLRHHNPFSRGDRESIIRGMEEAELQFPGKVFKVKRSVAEGNFVVIHSHLMLTPGELELATIHILRFQGGKIVELWDIGQAIPKDSPNENSMF
jgi:predicted SnoaL-like aldol condensation-catalyzing enzyme